MYQAFWDFWNRNLESDFGIFDPTFWYLNRNLVAFGWNLTEILKNEISKTHQNLESDLSIAKKLEFYARIVYEELSLERTVGIDFSISQFLNLVHNDFSKIQYHSASVLIKYLPKLLKIAGDSHHDLFQIGFNLLKFKSQLSPVEKGNLLVFLERISIFILVMIINIKV